MVRKWETAKTHGDMQYEMSTSNEQEEGSELQSISRQALAT